LISLLVVLLSGLFSILNKSSIKSGIIIKKESLNKFNLQTLPTPTSTPSPTPTPRPLTFAEMNALYGPCVHLPVLMYHHVQSEESAKANKQTSISTYTDYFDKQMQYLKDKGYQTIPVDNLINFFDNGTPIPPKSILITFDDGYSDFATEANPILQKFGFKAVVFLPTGLMENSGYLTWNQIKDIGSSIFFANHTWSHKNVGVNIQTLQYEISTADTQLTEHNLNSPKVFAYPYGIDTKAAEKLLESTNYKLAFTTVPGSILCKKQRFSLPRLRIGNISLSSYGF